MNFVAREIFRLIRLFFGLFFYALGIVMTMYADVGYSPWDAFQQGLTLHLGITMGQANILVAAVIVFMTVFTQEKIGIGTLCNMLFIGIFIDILLTGGRIPMAWNLASSTALMAGGLLIIGLASYLYIGAGYGSGPRDTLMVLLTKWSRKPVGLCQSCLQGTVLLAGWLLGGYIGIGTVIYVFGVGSAIQLVFTIMRFDVKKIHQESCYETFMNYWGKLKPLLRGSKA